MLTPRLLYKKQPCWAEAQPSSPHIFYLVNTAVPKEIALPPWGHVGHVSYWAPGGEHWLVRILMTVRHPKPGTVFQ